MNAILTNSKYQKVFLFFFIFIAILSAGNFSSAHEEDIFWAPGDPIVPCTDNCTKCDLFHLIRHVIDFIMIAATPILATAFFILAGAYIMMGGAKPDMLATGKRIFSNTMIGLLIVMLAWLIVNTLIRTLAAPTIAVPAGSCIDYGGGSFECLGGPNAGNPCDEDLDCGVTPFETADWWRFSCPFDD